MQMRFCAVGLLLAAHLLGCGDEGEGDDDTATLEGGATVIDSGAGADAGNSSGGMAAQAGTAGDSGAALDARVSPLDASSAVDAGFDAARADAGGGDPGDSDAQVRDAGGRDSGGRDGGGSTATFTRVYAIVQGPCRNCHMGNQASGGLNLSSKATAFMELTSPGDAEGNACMGGNRKRVVPFMPENSLLIKKLTATQDCGEQMPERAPQLPPGEIAEVRAWIMAGALNN